MAIEPILRLRSCIVRPYDEAEVEQIAAKANNPNVSRWMRNAFPCPYTVSDAKVWVAMANAASPVVNFAICRTDGSTFIGGIGLKAKEDIYYRTMEVGYWISEDCWGQGIATEVLSGFSEWVFGRFHHVLRLEAETFEANEASGRVLQKAGFEFEGRRRKAIEKRGVVMDAMIYCRFRE